MIKNTELRIGNWIDMMGMCQVGPSLLQDAHRYENGNIHADPIPLTADILKKCGFEVKDDNPKQKPQYEGDVLVTIVGMDWSNSGSDGFYTYALFPGERLQINFLHELQNLVFALTRVEIEFKQDAE